MIYKYEHKIKMYSLGVYVARQNLIKYIGNEDSIKLTDIDKSKIVETLLVGAPFPPVIMYEEVFDTNIIKNGIIVKTLLEFENNKFSLRGLETAKDYEGYRYCDFSILEERRLLNKRIATYCLNDIPTITEIVDIKERFKLINNEFKTLSN